MGISGHSEGKSSVRRGLVLQVVFTKLAESSWRTLLFWIGPPGLVIAGLALLTLAEPRTSSTNFVTSLMNSLRPKPKTQVPAEDMVTATQYSRVRHSLLNTCLLALQICCSPVAAASNAFRSQSTHLHKLLSHM